MTGATTVRLAMVLLVLASCSAPRPPRNAREVARDFARVSPTNRDRAARAHGPQRWEDVDTAPFFALPPQARVFAGPDWWSDDHPNTLVQLVCIDLRGRVAPDAEAPAPDALLDPTDPAFDDLWLGRVVPWSDPVDAVFAVRVATRESVWVETTVPPGRGPELIFDMKRARAPRGRVFLEDLPYPGVERVAEVAGGRVHLAQRDQWGVFRTSRPAEGDLHAKLWVCHEELYVVLPQADLRDATSAGLTLQLESADDTVAVPVPAFYIEGFLRALDAVGLDGQGG